MESPPNRIHESFARQASRVRLRVRRRRGAGVAVRPRGHALRPGCGADRRPDARHPAGRRAHRSAHPERLRQLPRQLQPGGRAHPPVARQHDGARLARPHLLGDARGRGAGLRGRGRFLPALPRPVGLAGRPLGPDGRRLARPGARRARRRVRPVPPAHEPRRVGARGRAGPAVRRERRRLPGDRLLRLRPVRDVERAPERPAVRPLEARTVRECRLAALDRAVALPSRARALRHLPRRVEPADRRPGARQRGAAAARPRHVQRGARHPGRRQGRLQQLPVRVRRRRAHLQRAQGEPARHPARVAVRDAAGGAAAGRPALRVRAGPPGGTGRRLRGRHHAVLHLPDLPHGAHGRAGLQPEPADPQRPAAARPDGRQLLDAVRHPVDGSAGAADPGRRPSRRPATR